MRFTVAEPKEIPTTDPSTLIKDLLGVKLPDKDRSFVRACKDVLESKHKLVTQDSLRLQDLWRKHQKSISELKEMRERANFTALVGDENVHKVREDMARAQRIAGMHRRAKARAIEEEVKEQLAEKPFNKYGI